MINARVRITAALVVAATCTTSPDAAAQPEEKPEEQPAQKPRGWSNPRAFELAKEALVARKEGDPYTCVEKDRESLALEEHPYVRLHFASCLANIGHLLDALRSAKDALEAALRDGDEELKRIAAARVTDLLARIAHVRFAPNVKTPIRFDGSTVPEALLGKSLAVDPGEHVVEIEGGPCGALRERFTLVEGEERTVGANATPDCPIPGPWGRESKIEVLIGLQMSAYTDTNRVNVLTPALNAAIASPVQGWRAAGSYLVDVVSSASPDVVSTGSPRFHETRHEVTGEGGYKYGLVSTELRGRLSTEPDCLSILGGGAVSVDLEDITIVPRLGFSHREDRIGVRGTPFSQLERRLAVNDFEGGASFILSPTTLLVTRATLETMRGDPSNPYRYVPLFAPDVAPAISSGASNDVVNDSRLPLRPREQLPTERDRFALSVRINHRFSSTTLRLEERGYVDTWGIKASTTDARLIHDLHPRVALGPHVRFHGQSGASFYELAYVGDAGAVPLYRTTARELSPMIAVTAGGTVRLLLGSERAESRYSMLFSNDVAWARFFDSLYVTSRTAYYATLGFEAEL